MIPTNCVHFNGINNETCQVGRCYLNMARPLTDEEIQRHNEYYPDQNPTRTAIARRVPCLSQNSVTTCPDFRLPTQEELDKFDKEVAVILENILKARMAITEYLKATKLQKRDVRGSLPCPICGTGNVIFSYAGKFNGHIHAKCTTDDCVQWIE